MHATAHEILSEETTVSNEVSIVELYLVTANTEKEIHEYLLQNGAFLDPKTRVFLANIRDMMGATSRRAKKAATASRT